jgi:transcriptional regulator with XRE-family HTH domain
MARDSDAIPNLRLQDYRRRLDLTQDQVADELRRLAWEHFGVRVGVDGQMVSKWERGEKRPSRFYRQLLCLLYSMTEEQLGLRVLEVVSTVEDGYDRLEEPVDASEDGLKRRQLLGTAAALGAAVMLPDWLGQLAPRQAGEPPELAGVRDALMRYDSLAVPSDPAGEPCRFRCCASGLTGPGKRSRPPATRSSAPSCRRYWRPASSSLGNWTATPSSAPPACWPRPTSWPRS